MAEINAFIMRPDQFKGRLTLFGTYFRNYANNIDFDQLSLRKEKVKEV